MDTTTEKMVEIARFPHPTEAQTLMALLKSEDIDCYLRNEHTVLLMGAFVDVGGARVEILESNVDHALEVMQANGYAIPEEGEIPGQMQAVGGWARQIPLLRRLPLEKQILGLFILLAICLGLFIYYAALIVES
jgi:hypothetical protein